MAGSMDRRVRVFPFTRQADGSEVVIGRTDTARYVALPPQAVEVLDDLAAGHTLSEAQERFSRRHGQLADVEALVAGLAAEGFVAEVAEGAAAKAEAPAAAAAHQPKRFHMAGFPEWLARAIFSRATAVLGGAVVLAAIAAVFADPSILPGPKALFFAQNTGTMVLWLGVLLALQITIHEMSHLVAARARGVPVRFGVGHRMWIVVLETDMSGVWGLPRNKRYLPMLAGSLVDLVSASALVLVLAAHARGMVAFSPLALGVLRALVIVYFYQILWQCFFFIRTDFYYAIANAFGCKNLMADTKVLVRNAVHRLTGLGSHRDQSAVPAEEMRVVRRYAFFFIAGRVLAIYLLVVVQVPLILSYLGLIGRTAMGMSRGAPMEPVMLVPAVLGLFTFSLGMYLWIRSIHAARVAGAPIMGRRG